MSKINEVPDFEAMFKTIVTNAPRVASVMALNFFKGSFANQGFTDAGLIKWDTRKNDNRPGGAVLTSTGNLRDIIVISKVSLKQVILTNAAPYAKIHNDGGTITVTVTPKMKKYFWFMFKATGNSMYKGMALTKKSSLTIKIPQRQFMGDSQTLTNSFDNWMANEIAKAVIPLK